MSIQFSTRDLLKLTEATRLLLSPLDFPTVDAWRSSVNQCLRELLNADSAGFLLPVSSGLAMYSEEHDPAALTKYPELTPPCLSDGTPIWRRSVELGVTTLREGYGMDYTSYMRTAYHNEFAAPNRAFDTLGAWCSLGGADPGSAASLQFWHSHPTRRCFGTRELLLLRHLFPAFTAGVRAHAAWSSNSPALMSVLDSLQQAALVGDVAGRIVHQTPALEAALAGNPDHEHVRAAMLDLLALCALLHRQCTPIDDNSVPLRIVTTSSGRYRVRSCLYGEQRSASGALVIIVLETQTSRTLSSGDLRARFGLTPTEVRVAMLLARGRSNVEIARELIISPHTSKRHTEHVLRKLGARSRAEVASMLAGAPEGA